MVDKGRTNSRILSPCKIKSKNSLYVKYNVRMLLINRKTQSSSSSWMSGKRKALMILKKGLWRTQATSTWNLISSADCPYSPYCYKVMCWGQTLGHRRRQCFSEADGASQELSWLKPTSDLIFYKRKYGWCKGDTHLHPYWSSVCLAAAKWPQEMWLQSKDTRWHLLLWQFQMKQGA